MKKTISLILAAVLSAMCFSGCGSKEETEGTTVTWYVPLETHADNQLVYDAVAEKVKEKTGINLKISTIGLGNYNQKMQVMNTAMEDMDIVYTSSTTNNYYTNVENERLLPLDDYLKTVGKEMYESIPEYMWEATKIDGKIYAVPNQQIVARGLCFFTPKQNIDLLGIDPQEYLNVGDDYKSQLNAVEKYLRILNKETGTYTPIGDMWATSGVYIYGFDPVLGSDLPGVIRATSDDPYTVINQYETQEFKDYIETRAKWVKEGLVQPEKDIKIDHLTYLENGQVAPELCKHITYKPGGETIVQSSRSYEPQLLIRTKPMVTRTSILATMNAVSAQSKNPEAAVKVLNLINTDKEIYNIFCYGIEGKHYEKIGENKVRKIENSGFDNSRPWALGNTFNLYVEETDPDDVWEQTAKLNDESFKSPIIGFAPSTANMTLEIAACQSAIDQYLDSLIYGTGNTEAIYAEFISRLKAGGVDKIISELQSQVDAWLATQ